MQTKAVSSKLTSTGSDSSASHRSGGFLSEHWHYILALAFITAQLVFVHKHDAFINIFESGVSINCAQRILDGQLPYRDFFYVYGPALSLFWLFCVKVAGSCVDSVLIGQLVSAWSGSLTIYLISRKFTKSRLLQVIAAFNPFAGMGVRLVFPMLSIFFLDRWTSKLTVRAAAVSGACAAIAGFFWQDLFPYEIAAVFAWFSALAIVQFFRPQPSLHIPLRTTLLGFVGYMLGFSGAVLAVLAVLAAGGMLQQYLYDNFLLPLSTYTGQKFCPFPPPWQVPDQVNAPVSKWSKIWGASAIPIFMYTLMPYYVVPLLFVTAIVKALRDVVVRNLNAASAIIVLTSIFGLVLFRSGSLVDSIHIRVNAFPALIVAVYLSDQLYSWCRQHRSTLVANFALLLCVVMFVGEPIYEMIHKKVHANTQSYTVPLGMHPITRYALWPDVWETASYVRAHTSENDSIFCAPCCPMFYALSGRRNPTQYDYFDTITGPVLEQNILAELQKATPSYCIVQPDMIIWGKHFGIQYGNKLNSYVQTNYVPERTFGKFVVYHLKKSLAQ